MFHYTISKEFDHKAFKEICAKIENNVENIKKCETFNDFLDGDSVQNYFVGSKRIVVNNDSQVDALYVDSEIDLNYFLKASYNK